MQKSIHLPVVKDPVLQEVVAADTIAEDMVVVEEEDETLDLPMIEDLQVMIEMLLGILLAVTGIEMLHLHLDEMQGLLGMVVEETIRMRLLLGEGALGMKNVRVEVVEGEIEMTMVEEDLGELFASATATFRKILYGFMSLGTSYLEFLDLQNCIVSVLSQVLLLSRYSALLSTV